MESSKTGVKTKILLPEAAFDARAPQAIEAETAVIGSVMIDNDCIGKVIEIVDESCFYKPAHQKIYAAALMLYEKSEPVDIITLSEELKREKLLDEIGASIISPNLRNPCLPPPMSNTTRASCSNGTCSAN